MWYVVRVVNRKLLEYACNADPMQKIFDMYDPEESKAFTVSFLRKRTRIVEIISATNLIFCLSQSGVCSVVDRGMLKCCVNSY